MATLVRRSWRSALAARDTGVSLTWTAIVIALFGFVTVGAVNAGAQESTPVAGQDIPSAAECTVQPRSEEELRALFREVAATPLPDSVELTRSEAPQGEPADAQTVEEINATWRTFVACLNAGDQARMFALYSDEMVRRQLVVDIGFGVTEDALFDFLAATPSPLPSGQGASFEPFTDVVVLSDGRVAAIGPGEEGRSAVRVFARQGDHWVIDDWYDLT
jgi:hypothetical protein